MRFSFSKTVSVPEFKEVAPFVYEGVSQRIGGNPDLINDPSFSEIYNLDLKYEWFRKHSQLLSLGIFGKQINNPVNLAVAIDATGTQRYFRTGDRALVFGVEFEARQNLLYAKDDDESTLLSVGLNATYMYTEQDQKSTPLGALYTFSPKHKLSKLQGASPLIINTDISFSPKFKKYKPTATLVFSYFYDRIDTIGSGSVGNIREKEVPTLDFVLKNKIGKAFECNVSVMNILDPSIRFVRETNTGDVFVNSANGKGVTNYKRGIDLSLQLKYKF